MVRLSLAASLLLLAVAALGCSGSVPPPGATLSGVVYHDTNANGVRDSCDENASLYGLATVRLSPATETGKSYTGKGAGAWKIENVPAGEYTLTLQDPLEEPPWLTTGPRVQSGEPRYELSLRGFESREDLNFGVAYGSTWSYPGSRPVFSLIFEDLDGDGETDAGECALEPGTLNTEGFMQIDSQGQPQWFEFHPYSGEPGLWKPTTRPIGNGCFRTTPERVSSGRVAYEARLGVQRATGTGSISVLVFEDANADGSRNPEEQPIKESGGHLAPDSDNCLIGRPAKSTSAQGVALFTDLPRGEWWVSGYVDDVRNDCQVDSTCNLFVSTLTTGENAKVQLDEGETITVEVGYRLSRLGEIQVRVVEDLNGNGAVDPEEPAPTRGAQVCHLRDGTDDVICQATSSSGRAIFRLVAGKGTVYFSGTPENEVEVEVIEGKKRSVELVVPADLSQNQGSDEGNVGISGCTAISC
jgi:hypothetical protein